MMTLAELMDLREQAQKGQDAQGYAKAEKELAKCIKKLAKNPLSYYFTGSSYTCAKAEEFGLIVQRAYSPSFKDEYSIRIPNKRV